MTTADVDTSILSTLPPELDNITFQLFIENLSKFNQTQLLPVFECNLLADVGKRRVSPAEILACIIAILTVFENIIILIAILTGPRSLRKPPYWFIASLAAADFFTGIEIVLAIFVPVGESPNSRIVLKVSPSLFLNFLICYILSCL